MVEARLLDSAGRRRSPASMPGYHLGRIPRNKGQRYPADPPRTEEIVAVMRHAGADLHGDRVRALIVILWRAGLRIQEALSLTEPTSTRAAARSWCAAARADAGARSAWTSGALSTSNRGGGPPDERQALFVVGYRARRGSGAARGARAVAPNATRRVPEEPFAATETVRPEELRLRRTRSALRPNWPPHGTRARRRADHRYDLTPVAWPDNTRGAADGLDIYRHVPGRLIRH